MRKLNELIVLVRGGGEVGSAVAHRLMQSHFRLCITEIEFPLAVSRGTCFSEAVYDNFKVVEGIKAEKTLPNLESIYKVWRNHNLPVIIDAEFTVKPLIKPDVLVNAMMLKRKTSTKIADAPLVIGIGPGFSIGEDCHLVVESNNSNQLGKVILEGEAEKDTKSPVEIGGLSEQRVIWAEDAGVFTTHRNIGDSVIANDIVGFLGNTSLAAPVSGVLRGLLRNEVKVLAGAKLVEVDPYNDKSVCFSIRDKMRAIAGGVLEAIMMRFNMSDANLSG